MSQSETPFTSNEITRYGFRLKPSDGSHVFEKMDKGEYVTWAAYELLLADRDRLRETNQQALGKAEGEIERLRPMAESWESYEAAQARKAEMGLTNETGVQRPFHLNAYQLKQALDLCGGEEDTELVFLKYAEDRHEPGEHGDPMPAGTYCWFPDYPEEGQLLLKEERPEGSPEETTSNEANATSSGVESRSPTPRGTLPNSLGASSGKAPAESRCLACRDGVTLRDGWHYATLSNGSETAYKCDAQNGSGDGT